MANTTNHGSANRQRDEQGQFTDNNDQNQRASSQSQESQSGEGRGWHGDPQGHARAGSQSHKNDNQ